MPLTTITPIGVELTTSETTVVSSSTSERTFEYCFLSNKDVSNLNTATIRIKNGSTIIEEFTNIGVSSANGDVGNGGLYLWDRQFPRRLPSGWTITAFASKSSVLRVSFGGVSK